MNWDPLRAFVLQRSHEREANAKAKKQKIGKPATKPRIGEGSTTNRKVLEASASKKVALLKR